MTPPTLLDTDVFSQLMRQTATVVNRARIYRVDHVRLTISLMTRFEILRGLRTRNAGMQLAAFDVFCATNEVLPLTDAVIDRGAYLYADLNRRGQLIGDADILIAATALEHGLVLATANVRHFSRISGLQIDDWTT